MSAVIDTGLLGEKWRVQDFIQVSNPQMQAIARQIHGKAERTIAENVLAHVCRRLKYPLTWKGQPATWRQTNVFQWVRAGPLIKMYKVDVERDYGWLLPNQVAAGGKYAICIDSACYCTTLLRIKGLTAMTAMGAIVDAETGDAVGLHAWTVATVNGVKYVLETTVHPYTPGLIPADEIYWPASWNGVGYDEIAVFDERSYIEDKAKSRKYSRFAKRFIRKVKGK